MTKSRFKTIQIKTSLEFHEELKLIAKKNNMDLTKFGREALVQYIRICEGDKIASEMWSKAKY